MSGFYGSSDCNHPQYGCACSVCLAWFGKKPKATVDPLTGDVEITPGGSEDAAKPVAGTTSAESPGDSSCRDCGGPQHIIYPCPQWRPQTMIATCDALAEVERQAALVARLDFDLRMLKLLGRGYSRRDLEAELALRAKR